MIIGFINAYYYAPLDKTYHSHCFNNELLAILASRNKFPRYKTIYRIRVRLK